MAADIQTHHCDDDDDVDDDEGGGFVCCYRSSAAPRLIMKHHFNGIVCFRVKMSDDAQDSETAAEAVLIMCNWRVITQSTRAAAAEEDVDWQEEITRSKDEEQSGLDSDERYRNWKDRTAANSDNFIQQHQSLPGLHSQPGAVELRASAALCLIVKQKDKRFHDSASGSEIFLHETRHVDSCRVSDHCRNFTSSRSGDIEKVSNAMLLVDHMPPHKPIPGGMSHAVPLDEY
ncbi:hypothetical protein F2P81_022801 [Scophthalmus maximus]|uniref:Uncharacterized protein n=1 Tax=Scophthalmus maximus TaxID=52904 RepID=A0A6A4S2N1_SCOMX|nr:hypothetical protein F2P81_022801 [Scophthalmus maximus]